MSRRLYIVLFILSSLLLQGCPSLPSRVVGETIYTGEDGVIVREVTVWEDEFVQQPLKPNRFEIYDPVTKKWYYAMRTLDKDFNVIGYEMTREEKKRWKYSLEGMQNSDGGGY